MAFLQMIERHRLSPRLCFVDKTRDADEFTEEYDEPVIYNQRVEQALQTLHDELPTFAVLGEGVEDGQQSCLLIEKGKFYGMGYVPLEMKMKDAGKLKKVLTPYHDNDFIRDMIYRYAETNPQQIVRFSEE